MTAPSREPTEAMRSRAWDTFAEIERAPLQAPEIIARALMEQDAAARREGFEQAREMAANVCGQPAEALLGMRLMGETTMGLFARVIRALTPEPPSEKP